MITISIGKPMAKAFGLNRSINRSSQMIASVNYSNNFYQGFGRNSTCSLGQA
jgi:hypothetical protein